MLSLDGQIYTTLIAMTKGRRKLFAGVLPCFWQELGRHWGAGFFALLLFFAESFAFADFGNYNSVLIGEEAAGMGGTYTAFVGDPAASPFYNPASLARMVGNTLSAAVSVYHKYDTKYGDLGDFTQAPLRVNRGAIVPLPAASGTAYTFHNFAFGLSIVFPDFDYYTGDIRNTSTNTSYLSLRDESLWVGGSLALNTTEKESIGLTMYYTSRSYSRSVLDQTTSGGVSTQTSSEKYFSQNSLVYILGWRHQFDDRWSVGASYRFSSLPISGRGSYFATQISSGGGPITPTSQSNLDAETVIPSALRVGVGYDFPKVWKLGLDLQLYGQTKYIDLKDSVGGDIIEHQPILNASLGGGYFIRHWLAVRAGVYSNFSSHKEIPDNPSRRLGEHIDMWGFSTHFAIFTSELTSVTLGGYYSGGKGYSVQQADQSLQKISKSQQIFSFLVGTSFHF